MEITYIAIFIAWTILTFYYPRVFLIILSALFPLYLIKFSLYGVPFTFVEWLVYASAVSFIVLYRKNIIDWRRNYFKNGFLKKIDTWIFIFLIAGVISVFITPFEGKNHAFGILKGWLIAPAIYFFLIRGFIKELSDARRFLDAYAFSASVLGIWGIYQYLHGFMIDNRIVGPFTSANYLAFFIAPAFIYSAISAWQNIQIFEIPWWKKVLIKLFRKEVDEYRTAMFFVYLVFALITGFALIATNSYGAFIGVITAFIFYFIYHYFYSPWKKSFKEGLKKFIIFAAVLIAVLGFVVPKLDVWKFNTLFDFKTASSSAIRVETWEAAGKLITKNPVFGIGLGQFQDQYKAQANSLLGHPLIREEVLHPHNLIMTTWLYTGILGLFAFIFIIVKFFLLLRSKNSEARKTFTVILCAMMLAIIAHGIVDTPFWKNDLALQFWLIIGGAFGLSKK